MFFEEEIKISEEEMINIRTLMFPKIKIVKDDKKEKSSGEREVYILSMKYKKTLPGKFLMDDT